MATAVGVHACPIDGRVLIINCDSPFAVQFESLGRDALVPEAMTGELVVTGAYSSADRYGVEGLAIDAGDVISMRFQGWDGLLLISPEGIASIHHVERVQMNGQNYNLRELNERQAFMELAKVQKMSVIQSHLLVTDGEIDVRDRDGQPRFRRRVLFSTTSGDVGIFDTGREALTLFDVATELHELGAEMAFNLDMGAYDYCAMGEDRCGLLRRENTRILTNVLHFIPSR